MRRRIDHFCVQPNTFQLAWHYLFKAYGRPEIIATCCEDILVNLERVKPHDLQALNSMAVTLQRAKSQLQDVEHCTTLNSLATLKQLMANLPEIMQNNWMEDLYRITQDNGRRANFTNFVEFVSYYAKLANFDFGSLQWSTRVRAEPNTSVHRKKVSVFVTGRKSSTFTAVLYKEHCPLCGSAHPLSSCEQFIKLSRYKKSDFLKKNGRCFKCFEKGHIVKDCKVEIKCTVEGCDKQETRQSSHFNAQI